MKLFTGLAGLALLGLGLVAGIAGMLVTDRALQANLYPVSFVFIGLGVIVLGYWAVPRRSE